MTPPVPVTVGIPSYARGDCVFTPIERVLACNPPPAEIIVHVDASDGGLERRIHEKFPHVRILSSQYRIGPGGGRDRCLRAASHPYFASFDDDSWPVDPDYFARVVAHFEQMPSAACLGATIFHRNQPCPPLSDTLTLISSFTGCGEAMRVAPYLASQGYTDRATPYGIEELDVSIQFHAAGHHLVECGDLRVFHDTILSHHTKPEVTAGTIANAALLAWLRYPLVWWPFAILQYVNVIRFMIREQRFDGILSGIVQTPAVVWRYRHHRFPVPAQTLASYLLSRYHHGPVSPHALLPSHPISHET